MAKQCKNCGSENRDNASFCSDCGVPLPGAQAAANPAPRRAGGKRVSLKGLLWFAGILAVLCLGAYMFLTGTANKRKAAALEETRSKFMSSDAVLFGGIKTDKMIFEKLTFGMTENQIRLFYPGAKISADPDFIASLMVSQAELKEPFPHASFMSLGMYNGSLYALKFEFGPSEDFMRQMVKIPDADYRLFGRFEGVVATLKVLLGAPAFEKNDSAKISDVVKRVKYVKAETLNGAPTNIYIYWLVGNTKVEAVCFSVKQKLHFTVRLLDKRIWEKTGGK